MTRPKTDIPQRPQPPFPITAKEIPIVSGFGRGSSELGIPTANVPIAQLPEALINLEQGVYFGYAKLHRSKENNNNNLAPSTQLRKDGEEVSYSYGMSLKDDEVDVVFPQVMSIGWNPFYGNKEKAVELHIVHRFSDTFYGAKVSFNVLGYIRPELNYTSKEALIKDIEKDIEIGISVLEGEGYRVFRDL
jgi:riboflavin kinase